MIPVTLITGFLGAGKTSLINQIIQSHEGTHLAIIENEVGELSIDHELLIGADAGIFQLSNGCICCSLQGDLLQTLEKLLSLDKPIDHLLIETTGIAEPDAIAAAFLSDEDIQADFRLQAVVCLADALHIEGLLAEREEARRQIAFADLILLSKTETLDETTCQALETKLHQANPLAQIARSYQGKTTLDLLQLEAYQGAKTQEQTQTVCTHKNCTHTHHHHHQDINTESFLIEAPLDFLKLRHWLQVLLLIQGASIYRIKGVLHCQGMEEELIFQSVQKVQQWQKGGKHQGRPSRLVFIGKNLRRDILEKNLNNCLAR